MLGWRCSDNGLPAREIVLKLMNLLVEIGTAAVIVIDFGRAVIDLRNTASRFCAQQG